MLITVALACTDSAGEEGTPTAYTYESPVVEGQADPVVIQSEVQDTLDNLRTFNAGPLITAWFQIRAYGDDMCPGETIWDSEDDGHVIYFDILCVVDDHIWFKGPMTTYAFEDNTLQQFEVYDPIRYMDGVKPYYTGQAIKGQTDVYDMTSDLDYNCSCTAILAEGDDEAGDFHTWLSYTDGPSHLTAPESDPTLWMNQGIFSHLYLQFDRATEGTRWQANLEGSVTGYTATYGDIELDLEIAGFYDGGVRTCEKGGGGTVEVRHTVTGQRTAMTFTVDETCNACADVGDGTVCLDFSTLADWEDSPW